MYDHSLDLPIYSGLVSHSDLEDCVYRIILFICASVSIFVCTYVCTTTTTLCPPASSYLSGFCNYRCTIESGARRHLFSFSGRSNVYMSERQIDELYIRMRVLGHRHSLQHSRPGLESRQNDSEEAKYRVVRSSGWPIRSRS